MLDGQWVMLTPSQVFAASSEEAMRRFGWHVNLSRDGRVGFFSLDLFREKYEYAPSVVTAWKSQEPLVRAESFELPSLVEITNVRVAGQNTPLATGEIPRPVDLEVDLLVRPTGS